MMTMQHNQCIRYYYKKEDFENEEQKYSAYSIFVSQNKKIIKYVPDVFLNKSDAENFVYLCNKYELSPIHVIDLIEDFHA